MATLFDALMRSDVGKKLKKHLTEEKRLCPICVCLQAAWIYDMEIDIIEEDNFAIFKVLHFYPEKIEREVAKWVVGEILNFSPEKKNQFTVEMYRMEPPTEFEQFKGRYHCGEGDD